jgi:ParB family transcriptional regulator, chromosome partitioning protein
MQCVGQKISLCSPESIDTSSPVLFWSEEPDERFLQSMERYGQIQPVQIASEHGAWVLLSGYKRVRAALLLGLPVRAVELTSPAPLERGLLYLLANLDRAVSEAMQVRALRYFRSCCGADAISEQVYPLLGIAPGSRQGRTLVEWLGLPESWDEVLKRQAIPLAASEILIRFSPGEKRSVEPFFQGLKWSRQNSMQWLTWLYECSRAEGTTVDGLIERTGMRGILTQGLEQGLSPKDTIERLTRAAGRLRFPRLSEMHGLFETLAAALTRGTDWRLTHGTAFESPEIELHIRCRSQSEVERAVRTLLSMRDQEEWNQVWPLLCGSVGSSEEDDRSGSGNGA